MHSHSSEALHHGTIGGHRQSIRLHLVFLDRLAARLVPSPFERVDDNILLFDLIYHYSPVRAHLLKEALTNLCRFRKLAFQEVNLLVELRYGVVLSGDFNLKIAHAEH